MNFRSKLISNNQGATLVEFALSSVLLFMFLILGLDVLRLAYHTSTLQYVLGKGAAAGVIKASAARMINASDGEVVMEPPATRMSIIKNEIRNLGDRFGLGIEDGSLAICTNIENSCFTIGQSAGESKDFVRVDFQSGFPFIWGAWNMDINLYVIVKNEPF